MISMKQKTELRIERKRSLMTYIIKFMSIYYFLRKLQFKYFNSLQRHRSSRAAAWNIKKGHFLDGE